MNIQERDITSITDAIITARELSRNGGNACIYPCDKPTAKGTACPLKDPGLKILCKQGDGLLPEAGVVFCPLQKGILRITAVKAEK